MAKAHLEITTAIVRVGSDDFEFGDEFEFSIFITGDEGTAILKGMAFEGFDLKHRDAVGKVLKENGFTHVGWWRHYKDKEPRFVKFRLS